MVPNREFLFRGPFPRWPRLPAWAERLLYAGVVSTDRLVRRRQLFTNIVAYVAAFNAGLHFISNSLHDFRGLLVIHAYNLVMVVFCAANHRLHAFGDLTAAIVLIVGIAIGHSFVVFALGTASDLHFYFTLAAFALFLVGVENFRVFLALYAIGFAALFIAFAFAPENGFVQPEDRALRRTLSIEAAMNAFVMNGLLVSFVLTALYRAEERSEALLSSMLPKRIAERLKESADSRIADHCECCTVLFVDLVGFTEAARDLAPSRVVSYLDTIFSRLDAVCERFGVDKIKTIGDCYMAVGGLSGDPVGGARAIGLVALEFLEVFRVAPPLGHTRLQMRAGIHTGPATAGVIGETRIAYDVWGDTVNVASRLESHGAPGRIHVSAAYKERVASYFAFEPRGNIEMKGVGAVASYFLIKASPSALGWPGASAS